MNVRRRMALWEVIQGSLPYTEKTQRRLSVKQVFSSGFDGGGGGGGGREGRVTCLYSDVPSRLHHLYTLLSLL